MKLFIGYYQNKQKDEWFFCWAHNKEEAIDLIDGIYSEPFHIEEVEDQSGFVNFKVIEEKEDDRIYNRIKACENELFFDDYEWIEHIISEERSEPIEINKRRIRKKNDEFLNRQHKE